jgi:sarcosine oxidase subunit gamma
MPDLSDARIGPLDGLDSQAAAVTIEAGPFASRLAFRGDADAVAKAGSAFGVAFPSEANRASTKGARSVLWLGPDEFLLVAPDGEAPAIEAAIASALGAAPHSLVDVSERNASILVAGPEAETVLGVGCLLDLHPSVFPVGMSTRTLFAKAEIVLWRTGAHEFHIEVWRSFAPYVWGLLLEGQREFRD